MMRCSSLWAVPLIVTAVAAARAQDATDDRVSNEITNSLGIRLRLIPPGEFQMGCEEPAEVVAGRFADHKLKLSDLDDELPRHRVRITRPFYMGRTEVTFGQFRRFVEASGYKTEAETDGQGGWGYNPETQRCEGRRRAFNWRQPGFPQSDEHPVVNVSWNDAVAFCRWLSDKEHQTYRLPTEAEWEYACRAGTSTCYNFGSDPAELAKAAHVFDARGVKFAHVQHLEIRNPTPTSFTIPVGRLQPNRFGLHDMHGNVWEWCADWYGEDYYTRSPVDDPQGPTEGEVRVRRGAGWNGFPPWVRSSFRNIGAPDNRCLNVGLRVVRNAS